jgi:biopolymer transport protein ExbB
LRLPGQHGPRLFARANNPQGGSVLKLLMSGGLARVFWLLAALLIVMLPATFWSQAAGQDGQPPAQAQAATDGQPAETAAPDVPESFFDLLAASGLVGLIIVLMSVAVVALVIEHLMTIRASVLLPRGLADEVVEALKAGNVPAAVQRCKLQPSMLSSIVLAGLTEPDGKWSSREKAMEDAAAAESARLYRKIEYLAVIGNIAPMLGLLGTVMGMMLSFRTIASTQGVARPEDLAGGIYLALVTTVEGLVVAIPALLAFAFFRNQIDRLVAEAAVAATSIFAPFRRAARTGERES